MICVMKRFAPAGLRYHQWLQNAATVVGTLLLVVGSPYAFAGAGQESAAQSTQTYRTVAPILGNALPLKAYEPSSWGPTDAEHLISSDGGWHNAVTIDAKEGDAG